MTPAPAPFRLDPAVAGEAIDSAWESDVVPRLEEYIRIPNKSPLYDARWRENGHMERAVDLIAGWCRRQPIDGLSVEVVRLEDRTPVILAEVPGEGDDVVLLYGHLDKQPEMTGWREDLGPWTPKREGDRLYGRGGADDGYAAFASLSAIRFLREHGGRHARCVVLIEACEESGSYDLPHYVRALRERIGEPSLVVCLDSGAGDYARLWNTTSLRGIVTGELRVELLSEGVHSGDASGIVPDGMRVARRLLSRIEDEETGRVLPETFHADVPADRVAQAREAAEVLGGAVAGKYPFLEGCGPVRGDPAELVLNRTWRPALSITGAAGLPSLEDAGNVCRPRTSLMLSLRLPPTVDAEAATAELKSILEADPPYGARVAFLAGQSGDGWNAPPAADWLARSVDAASRAWFDAPACSMGEGGSIPFMGMLGEEFPRAQFLITGVLGPRSNAHGPNEFLHLPTAKKLTGCVAQVLADHLGR